MSTDRLTPEQRLRVERSAVIVEQLARHLARRLGPITEDDLRSVGYEALVQCGLRYDPGLAASFRTFAFHRVRGAMIDAARRAAPGARRRSRALRAVQASQALLEHTARHGEALEGSDPRTLEERVEAAAGRVAHMTAVVVLSRLGGPDPEGMPDPHAFEDAVVEAQLLEHLRRTLARCCTEEERSMLTAIYEHGVTMTELGERAGRDKSTISRRHAALLERIAQELCRVPEPKALRRPEPRAGPR